MPTPPKPFTVLKSEGKSHRTKAELKQRKDGEAALSSGVAIKERDEVKNNDVAHKEFERLNGLLENIGKNDAIYETIINRYCMICAECTELGTRREVFYNLIIDLKELFDKVTEDLGYQDQQDRLIDFTREIAKLTTGMINIDKMLQMKRKMLLDIEKENIMTIAAALRSIPKKEEKTTSELLKALNGC